MYAKATRVRESRNWLFVSCLIAPGLAVFVVPASPPWAAPLAAFATMFAFLFAWALWPKSDEGRVVAAADGLRLGDRLLVKRSRIHSAHVRSARGVSWLCLQLKTGWVDVALADAGDEGDLLRSLRLDADGIVARYSAACDRRASGANVVRTLLTVGAPPIAIAFVFHASHGVHSVPLAVASLAVLLASTVGQLLASARSFEQVWV